MDHRFDFVRRSTTRVVVAAGAQERLPALLAEIGAPDEALNPEGWLRILPSQWAERGGVDGFFAARLERIAD
jgi:hypothetical protein